MPGLISFMLTRYVAGTGLGCIAALLIWNNGFATMSAANSTHYYLAQGLFVYLFANTMGLGYLATALMLDDA